MQQQSPGSKPVVPKFASFRPKEIVSSSKDITPDSQPRGEIDADEQSKRSREGLKERERRHHRGGRRRHRKEYHEDGREHAHNLWKSHRSLGHQDHERDLARLPHKETRIETWIDESDVNELYVTDLRGDPRIVTPASLQCYSVPSYRRTGYGGVLGAPKKDRIDRSLTTDRVIYVHGVFDKPGYELQGLSKQGKVAENTLRLVPGEGADDLPLNSDYVPLKPNRKRKRGVESPSEKHATDEVDYRSIEGKHTTVAPPIDSDLEYASDSSNLRDTESRDIYREATLKNSELSRQTKNEPENVTAWLELINHQEVMIQLGQARWNQSLSNSERRNLADIKISIYEQALKHIGNHEKSRVKLLLGLLEEGSRIWEAKKRSSKWKDALSQMPHNIEIWIRYLDFAQGDFAAFEYETSRKLFLECLNIIMIARSKLNSNLTTTQTIEESQLYVVLRMTAMMRQSGYHEHATAIWQALLEFHIFRPTHLIGKPVPDVLDVFEEFWDSEAPRIGEPNAKGWSVTLSSPINPAYPTHHQDPVIGLMDGFGTFYQEEKSREDAFHQPGRTTDEGAEEDPYHVILYTDLKDVLQLVSADINKEYLIDAYLCYMNLAPLPLPTRCSWWLNPFLRTNARCIALEGSHSLESEDKLSESERDISKDEKNQQEENLSSFEKSLNFLSRCPFGYFQSTIQNLLTFHCSDCLSKTELEWVERTLNLIANAVTDQNVAEYYLTFAFHFFPTNAVKIAKSLLKSRQQALRLYNMYALLEARRANTGTSNRVWSTAISKSKSVLSNQADVVFLWRSWIWETLRANDTSLAVHLLLLIGDDKFPKIPMNMEKPALTASGVLRSHQALVEGRDHALSLFNWYHFDAYSDCLALLHYFKNSGDLTAALDTYRQTSAMLETRNMTHSPANELIHQSRTDLLIYHAKHVRLFKPSVLRKALEESIRLFPNNTIFLSAFAANEVRFRIDDRVRTTLRDKVLTGENSTIVGWSFAIHAEMHRGEGHGWTEHAIRATFEKAVENNKYVLPNHSTLLLEVTGRHSIFLWTAFVLFELTHRPRERAKEVFFRGYRSLPWAKTYIMMAFRYLRHILTFDEQKALYRAMGEKELRVHIDMEDTLEEGEA
ncbi:DUF1740-domain-containing protein [Patellaria atrata CBS 101060]|uniref:DUF1740-domain-containing protein n=1 Tax=Patellaria atrata CBS 101060 TaxID=1346257 RepID=A0A9P4SJQ8_9PEZI|nr:DUF1740-domain-containing protein [Patellaria atrata CBS 101060]